VGAYRFSRDLACTDDAHHYWRDVGTIDAYWEANIARARHPSARLLRQDLADLDLAGSSCRPAKFVFDDDSRRGVAADSIVSGGCIVSGSTIKRSLPVSNVRVHSYCQIEDAVLLPNVDIGRRAVLRRSWSTRETRIPPGLEAASTWMRTGGASTSRTKV